MENSILIPLNIHFMTLTIMEPNIENKFILKQDKTWLNYFKQLIIYYFLTISHVYVYIYRSPDIPYIVISV